MPTSFDNLLKIARPSYLLTSVKAQVDWDQETYMPDGAIENRGEQTEYLSSLIHKEKISKRFSAALGKMIDLETGEVLETNLTDRQKKALELWRKDYLDDTKLPASFVQKFAKTTSMAINVWAKAKEKDDFNLFTPHLQSIVDLCRKKADYLGYSDHPYDALVGHYEPGMDTASLHAMFDEIKPFLIDLTARLAQNPIDNSFLFGNFPKEKQLEHSRLLLKRMGLDPNHSRLDITAHPFCSGFHPKDVRLTTHLSTSNFIQNLSAVMHEGGHGLYELGLPADMYGSPICEATSLGIHESQSRFWECFIGQSKPFWEYTQKELSEFFPEIRDVPLQDLYLAVNKVQPSLIRVFADEVTYILHVILRFELELALIEGSLSLKELPSAWNNKMQEYLGITPATDREGCLQDIHWAFGIFGYFPTYALGNLYAASFYEKIRETFPDIDTRLSKGDLTFLTDYLRTNIHSHGRFYSASELIQNITGAPLSSTPYKNYLTEKLMP